MMFLGFDIPLWPILLTIVLILVYVYTIQPLLFFYDCDLDGPRPLPLIGNGHQMMKEGIVHFERNKYALYKKKGKRAYRSFMGTGFPCVTLLDQELIKAVLIKDFQYFQNHTPFKSFNETFKTAMAVIRDDHWKHVRSSLTPTFSSLKLRRMSPLINNCCKKLLNNVKKYADENEVMNLTDMFGGYGMDSIASTLFGFDLDSQQNPDEPFVKNAKKLLDDKPKPGFFIIWLFPFIARFLHLFGIQLLKMDHMIFFKDIVTKALEDKEKDEEVANNFLDMVANLRVEDKDLDRQTGDNKWSTKGLTLPEITTQSMMFVLAGYQTTLASLIFMAYNLARNPDIQDKLIAEIDEQLQDGKDPSYDTIKTMDYLDMVFHESMRQYPPAVRSDRYCSETVEIDGFKFKKGSSVLIPIQGIHYDPDLWPEPLKFDPERFSAENRDKIHPLSWLPFGMGPRNCIGMRLAILEVKMAIVSVLQNYKFVTCPDTEPHPVEMNRSGMIPKNPLKIKVEQRSSHC